VSDRLFFNGLIVGFEEEDAKEIMSIMSKQEYRDFFIDHMMVEELGKAVPDEDDSPAKAGLAMFLSFLLFGSLPAWSYVIFYLAGYTNRGGEFGVSCAATAVALFLLGVVQAKFTEANKLYSGLLMTFQGALTAGSAYLVGWALNQALDVGKCPKVSG
jgi:VIT1/CCC1 family predicted Fe2+/Mn2+ transporter